ncbi:MAG: hypothetical protein J0G30_02145 [Actinomycetales bacterium]|nr:hypothetical protein [Actinomycetales bacterium]
MTALPRPSRRGLALAGAALLIAAGISGCSSAADPEGTDAPSADATDSGETGSATTGAACLVGSWNIPQDQMNTFYDAVEAENGGDLTFDVVGSTDLDFTADGYVYHPDFVLNLEVAGQTGTGTVGGEVRGNYTAADGVISTDNDDSSISLVVTVAGVEMDASSLGNDIIDNAPLNSVTFQCTGDDLVIDFATGSGSVPVKLTRN